MVGSGAAASVSSKNCAARPARGELGGDLAFLNRFYTPAQGTQQSNYHFDLWEGQTLPTIAHALGLTNNHAVFINVHGRRIAGGRYVSTSLAEKLATYLSGDSHKPPQELLSDREFQVLRLIASGKIVSEIAKELSLSVKTISTYRSRILEKMGMTNNAELTRYAMENGLLV